VGSPVSLSRSFLFISSLIASLVLRVLSSQACGKSSFSQHHLVKEGYTWINQDTFKTKEVPIALFLFICFASLRGMLS
jgi:hypothetical protein